MHTLVLEVSFSKLVIFLIKIIIILIMVYFLKSILSFKLITGFLADVMVKKIVKMVQMRAVVQRELVELEYFSVRMEIVFRVTAFAMVSTIVKITAMKAIAHWNVPLWSSNVNQVDAAFTNLGSVTVTLIVKTEVMKIQQFVVSTNFTI